MENSEVICISSDDEVTGQVALNGRQPVIKQFKNNYITSIKTEIISHESGEIPVCGQKRKASEIDENIFKSQAKVLREEKNVSEPNVEVGSSSSGMASECQSKETVLLKPKLVIKETKPFSPVEQDIFPMFISLCLQKDRSNDMKVITNKLKRRYEQLDLEYANSEAFIDFINEKRNHIMNSKNQLYTHIADVNNEMKSRCNGKSTLLSSNKKSTSSSQKVHSNSSELSSSVNEHTNNIGDTGISESNVTNEENKSMDKATEKKIKVILKAMQKCEKHIKKLEESEVNFDDDDNSSYISLERYKHRMVELYNKYCQYTGENIDAGRHYLRPKHLSTTGIVTVDHAITNFINSKLSKLHKLKKIGTFTDAVIFPDYKDILDCVERCNTLNNLGLETKQQQRIAKKAFIELGEYLQRSRRNDYWDTFSLYLENKEDDPASKDAELAQKLVQNKREGEQRLASVFDEYVKKQENVKDSLIDANTSSSEEDEEESIENEEGDKNNDEGDDISVAEGSLSTDKNNSSSESDVEEEEEEEEEEEIEEQEKKEKENKKDEEETDKDDNKVSTIEIDMNSKVVIKNSDIVKVDGDCRTNANKLKDTISDSKLKATNPSDDANIANCTNESNSGTTEGNNGMALPNDLVDEVSSVKVDVPVDRTKEDEANMTEESMDSKPLELEKPLLRVRSFARHPTTWKDGSEKVKESRVEKKLQKDKSATPLSNSFVDLTLDTSDENISVINSCANTGTESKMLPRMQDKLKAILVPAGPNGAVKLQNGQVIAPKQNILTIAKQPTVLSLIGQPVDKTQNALLKFQVRQNSERNVQIQPKDASAVVQHDQTT
ncbi:daxx-like protein isoform X2 [Halictus rubicundus]|uniref:daxx-like protein isoform X2 n=1 Tax=Halictus rubicundus TaxID=77578 RepID=UPI004036B24C